MSKSALSVMMKVGIISQEMTPQRSVTGIYRLALSLVAVAFSYFFIHVSFFGPPTHEIFKGTFLLGVIILSILLYRGRQRPIRDGVVWLDEFFSFFNCVLVCTSLAVAGWWYFVGGAPLWRNFTGTPVAVAGAMGALVGVALYAYEAARPRQGDNPSLSDLVYLAAGVASVVWWMAWLEVITVRIGAPVLAPVVFFSGMLAAVSFEIARRIVGPLIPLIGFLFLIYGFAPIAQSMPGLLHHPGFRMERVMEFVFIASDGMTGLIVNVFATFIVIFVILGAFLQQTGLGTLMIDTAYRLTGQRTGGPGIAAVVSSGTFGMISGSGVANVVTTGTFTIPLMRRVGYRPEFAGGVEAAASTGGSYMPPIMGAGAFLLAELTETSYFEVIKIALIPALLYYFSVLLMVYFRAARLGLRGVPASELPPWNRIVPRLHLLLPIPMMVYYLVAGDSAFLAAAKTILLIIMLKAADLLQAVRTVRSDTAWKSFLAISLAFGTVVYYYGMQIGAPFTWFVIEHVGIDFGDALYWVVAAFIVLKVGEILVYGPDPELIAKRADAGPTVAVAGVDAPIAPDIPRGSSGLDSIVRVAIELLRVTWVSMEAGAKNLLVVGCLAGVLGILLASATQSDLAGRVSQLLVAMSFGLLPLTIFWVIVAGYVVGMGLPITASYVILAVFAVGALTEFGVPALAAHMISYWVAVVSAVTPPVALAAFAASPIAQSDPMKTGVQAVRLASMIFVMPFLFVYTPLLLTGTHMEIAVTTAACFLGAVAWALFLETRYTMPFGRPLMLLAAACLLLPVGDFVAFVFVLEHSYLWTTYTVGAAVAVGTFLMQRTLRGRVLE